MLFVRCCRSVQRKLAGKDHYLAIVWACSSHDDQLDFLARMEAEGGEQSWDLHPDVFAAQFMALQKEGRYDDINILLESMLGKGIRQSNKSVHALERAGQRVRKERRATSEDTMSWVPLRSGDASIRRRVGL
jgi:hypothetical protein